MKSWLGRALPIHLPCFILPVQGIHVKFRFSTCAVHVVGTQCVYFHGVKFCEKEDKFLQLALHAYVRSLLSMCVAHVILWGLNFTT